MTMFSLLDERVLRSRGVKPTSLVLFLVFLMDHESVDSLIVQGPSNTIAMVNESTYFNCSTSIRPSDEQSIIWYHYPLDGGGQRYYVYDEGVIRTNYRNRFNIEIDLSSGTFNLLALRLESKDAGRYECKDDVHEDIGASAELTILGSDLVCESHVGSGGPTQCERAITPDEVQLSCRVTYNGRNAPQMVWRKSGNSSTSTKADCVNNYNRVTCNKTLTTNIQLSGSVYYCEMTTQQYSCSLEIPKMSYVFSGNTTANIAIDEEVKCSANSSQSCSYKWKWFSGSDSLTVSTDQTLKPTRVGSHRCEATCPIGNTSCVVDVMFAEVYSTPSTEANTGQYLWFLLLFFLILIIIFITIIVVLYRIRKRANKRSSTPRTEEPEDSDQPAIPLTNIISEDKEVVTHRPSHPESNEGSADDETEPQELQSAEENHDMLLLPDGRNKTILDEDDSDYVIRVTFDKTPCIGIGLSGGEIRGPMQYKDIQCSCERITCTQDEMEMEISNRSQRWMTLKHRNLITFHDVILKSPYVYIVTEYTAGGSVRDALKKCTKWEVDLPLTKVKDWAKQIANGMEYLHEKDIVHKNLNSVRILIVESFTASDIWNETLKISQFCLTDDNRFNKHVEKKSFAAPEVVDGIYDDKGDVWSFGIVIWEMMTRKKPYKNETEEEDMDDICLHANMWEILDSWPGELQRIFNDCRKVKGSERPTFSEIVESLNSWQPDNWPE